MEVLDELLALARPEIVQLQPYSAARTEGKQVDVRVYLDANENPYAPFPADGSTDGYNRYPEVQPASLRAAFAKRYGIADEQIFLSRGADEAIDLLIRIFCTGGKDAVLIAPPAFPMYTHSARVQGASIVEVPLTKHDFQLDVPQIIAAKDANPNVKLMMVASPNNPTATLLRREDLLAVARAFRGQALLVVDELYLDYSGAVSLAGEIAEHPNIVVLRSLSKEYSLAGERVGVTLAHPAVIGLLNRVSAPYSLSRSSIAAAVTVLSTEGIAHSKRNIERVLAERDRVAKRLVEFESVDHVYASDANFLLVRFVDTKSVVALCEERGIKVRDRSSVPGLEGCVRLSTGTPEENNEFLKVLQELDGGRK